MQKFLPILSFDTAAQQCAVALLGDNVALENTEPQRQGQSERLLPMIQDILGQAGLNFGNLAAVAVTTGPGSFTGLRVALAASHGIALAQTIPVIGIDSFAAFNASLMTADLVNRAVIVESRRAELYWRLLTPEGLPLAESAMDLPADIARRVEKDNVILCGDGGYHVSALIPGHVLIDQRPGPSALAIARIGAEKLDQGVPIYPPTPLYIRPPDAKPSNV